MSVTHSYGEIEMSEKISLKEVEQKIFVSTYQDGLMDILIGSVVLMFAVGPYLTPYLGDFWGSVIFLPFWAIVFTIAWLVRKFVVKPRVGSFKVGSWRQKRMLRFSLTMVVVFTLSAILGVFSAVKFEAIPGWMHTARFSLVIILAFSAVATFIKLHRLYLYGILIAAAPLVGELLWRYLGIPHHGYPVTFGLATLIIVGTGLTLLIRVIIEHPIEEVRQPREDNE
jgi:hypothetical protein